MKNTFMSALLVIALVTSLVSPSCAFVNGSMNFLEICNSAGETEVIAVSAGETSQQRSAHNAQPDCAFCFAGNTVQALPLKTLEPLQASSAYIKVSSGVYMPQGLQHAQYRSRAPPSMI